MIVIKKKKEGERTIWNHEFEKLVNLKSMIIHTYITFFPEFSCNLLMILFAEEEAVSV